MSCNYIQDVQLYMHEIFNTLSMWSGKNYYSGTADSCIIKSSCLSLGMVSIIPPPPNISEANDACS